MKVSKKVEALRDSLANEEVSTELSLVIKEVAHLCEDLCGTAEESHRIVCEEQIPSFDGETVKREIVVDYIEATFKQNDMGRVEALRDSVANEGVSAELASGIAEVAVLFKDLHDTLKEAVRVIRDEENIPELVNNDMTLWDKVLEVLSHGLQKAEIAKVPTYWRDDGDVWMRTADGEKKNLSPEEVSGELFAQYDENMKRLEGLESLLQDLKFAEWSGQSIEVIEELETIRDR